jgi:hypothetical protein
MHFTLRIASLWPGCWHAWHLGYWRGLALASAFGAALNAALVTTFVWPEWVGAGAPRAATITLSWGIVLGLWAIGWLWLRRDARQLAPLRGSEQQDKLNRQFEQAQHEYLKGHWIETETLLGQVLGADRSDVEARLLLACVQRRTKRWAEARMTLQALQDDDAAARWWPEIATELKRIGELEAEVSAVSGVHDDRDGNVMRAA